MIPSYSRVAAIDDVEDHLQKIVWGLGKAGFCVVPFLFEDGRLEAPPPSPLPGLRIVFTDIHLVGGGPNNEKTHAANIIRCLKSIVGHGGPYVLIFWSQFADDSARIAALITERAPEAGLTPPVAFGSINKTDVFKIPPEDGSDSFEPEKLRDLILEQLAHLKTLAISVSWEDRVARAASRTTDRLFQLVRNGGNASADWDKLLAYLACEAVGLDCAQEDAVGALDAALLPILEDQLSILSRQREKGDENAAHLRELVSAEGGGKCPTGISKSQLNASYLIEEIQPATFRMWGRGVVTELGGGFVNSGEFINAFGFEGSDLIRREFATRELEEDERVAVKLHVVELGPECDHVQGKVTTHRYLLAVLVPAAHIGAFSGAGKGKKPPSPPRFRNDSVFDLGKVTLNLGGAGDWHLLVSCRSFMSLALKKAVDGRPKLRLRRALIDELSHRYTTHARRPGVMRFFE